MNFLGELSKTKLVCMAETGGAGEVTLIANSAYRPKLAIFVHTGNNLKPNGPCALIPIQITDIICSKERDGDIKFYEVIDFIINDLIVIRTKEIEPDLIKSRSLLTAALDKSENYYCTRPYFIKERLTNN